jgi:hypothetical protein
VGYILSPFGLSNNVPTSFLSPHARKWTNGFPARRPALGLSTGRRSRLDPRARFFNNLSRLWNSSPLNFVNS